MKEREHRELAGLRRAAQGITGGSFGSPAEVVRWMLALQAQDYPGVRWSIGLRVPGWSEAAIEQAIGAGEIVRSWPLRGTLHLTAPEDLGWLLPLSAERQTTSAARRRRELGITDDQLARAAELARDLMAGGAAIRRDLLLEVWQRAGIPTDGQRGYHLLWNLGHAGTIVFGPTDGKHPTFALFEHWIPKPRRLDRDEALRELALRYFHAHGPATVRDLAWWASVTLSDARTGLAACGGELERREYDGIEYAMAPGLSPAGPSVTALPGFDEYLLGYQDRSAVLAAEHADRIAPGRNGIFLPTFLVDGRVAGTWRRRQSGKRVIIEYQAFGKLSDRATTGLQRAIDRYSLFLGKPAELRAARP